MQKRNNALVILAAVFLTFLCTLPMQWAVQNVGVFSNPVVFTGISGHLRLFCEFPLWFLLFLSEIGVLFSVTNFAGWTTFSKVWPSLFLLFPGFFYLAAVFCGSLYAPGNPDIAVGLGPWVALGATLAALLVVMPSEESGSLHQH